MREPTDGLTAWAIFLAVVLSVGLMTVVLAFWAYSAIRDTYAKDACRDRGGLIDHYDADRASYWRCKLPTPERAP